VISDRNFHTIQAAIDAAALISTLETPQVVLLSAGVYRENFVLQGEGLFLKGTGARFRVDQTGFESEQACEIIGDISLVAGSKTIEGLSIKGHITSTANANEFIYIQDCVIQSPDTTATIDLTLGGNSCLIGCFNCYIL